MQSILAAIPFPSLDPVALRLGPFAVRWYGLAYLAAFVIGYFLLRRLVRRKRLRINIDQLGDLVPWLVAGIMLGGRLGGCSTTAAGAPIHGMRPLAI